MEVIIIPLFPVVYTYGQLAVKMPSHHPIKKPRSFPGEKSTGALSERSVKYYSGRRKSNS